MPGSGMIVILFVAVCGHCGIPVRRRLHGIAGMLRAGCRLAWTGGPGWRAWREGLVSGGGLDCLAVGPRRSGAGGGGSPVRPGCGRLRGLLRHLAAAPTFTDVLGYGPAFRDALASAAVTWLPLVSQ